ncbi:MAG TPA: APC family permease [Terriglobales bacterium]|nr:APC family permease [Terriglobales bacterium]
MATDGQPHLKRVLGRWDLVLLFVVAIFNLNVVPSIAANGGVTVWLWLISLVLFFWPQGIAVIELAHRYPGEGGVYLWAKEVFGDFHGFLSGWCYWTNNMLYVPTVMLYFVGVSVFILGPSHAALADNKAFALWTSVLLLLVLAAVNIVGLGVGKWINNLGAIGTGIAAAVLVILGVLVILRSGFTVTAADFRVPNDPRFLLNTFGVICFALVGLELASIMGDEIREPQRTLPGAVLWGGVVSGFLYIAATLTLLVAVGRGGISVLQGIVQAVATMSARFGFSWIIPAFALMLSVSIAGIASAWLGGSARIPFVAGLDHYMPAWLGRIHPKYATPYVALLVHVAISILLCVVFFRFSSVQAAFQTMLSLAVVLQLVPYLYVFASLICFSFRPNDKRGVYSRPTLVFAGISGLVTTTLGIGLQYFPPQLVTSLRTYELEMIVGTLFFIGLAAYFFFIYGRSKAAASASLGTTASTPAVERSAAE